LQFEHWSIDIDFRISGHAPSLFGDGFAFFYVTEKYQEGPVFGFKDQFTGLGVFFDTFANGQHDVSLETQPKPLILFMCSIHFHTYLL
jgi:mannose-binding lectin 2